MRRSYPQTRRIEMAPKTDVIEQLQAKIAELEAEVERLKTVPMKYRRMAFNAQLQDENSELRAQLAARRMQFGEWQKIETACDLTLTAVECIKKLKAENESLRKDAERKTNGNRKIRDLVDGLLAQAGYAPDSSARHNLSLMNFDTAMAQGEK